MHYRSVDDLASSVHKAALPLDTPAQLDPLIRAVGHARYILLGEASHGTHEFYTWRTEITKRLVLEKRCSFIAVEGDWPDCYRLNRYVKGLADSGGSAQQVLHAFDRWPTWMWANHEVVELAEWLRAHNEALPADERVGFYGLDVYSLWDSMAAVVQYLETVDPALALAAKSAYLCFEPYGEDAQAYARATVLVPTSCEDEAVAVLRALQAREPQYGRDGREAYYNAEQNALIARGAEEYYRAMVRGGAMSWNVRDRHMVETLERLMNHHGDKATAIVWEHNTHIGDARYTDMAAAGMVNVGQLLRENLGRGAGVFLVGFGTYGGTVLAASEWGAPMQRMSMPDARPGSLEDVLHRAGGSCSEPAALTGENLMLLFDGGPDGGIAGLDEEIHHRAIGVVYNPQAERRGNYVPSRIPRRYDAFIFVDHTRALDALHMPVSDVPVSDVPVSDVPDLPETFPSGK